MIQLQTKLTVIDNSGVKVAQCINIPKSKKFASINDSILVAIKSTIPRTKINKKKMYKGIIVQTKKALKRPDGTYVKSDQNSVVLVKSTNEMLGNRVKSFVCFENKQLGNHTSI